MRVPCLSFMMTKKCTISKSIHPYVVKLTRTESAFRRSLQFPGWLESGVWRLNFEFDARPHSWNHLVPKIRGVRRTRLTNRSIPSDRQNFFCFQAETVHRQFVFGYEPPLNGHKIFQRKRKSCRFFVFKFHHKIFFDASFLSRG